MIMAYTWSTGRIKVNIGRSTRFRQQNIDDNEYPTKAQRGVQMGDWWAEPLPSEAEKRERESVKFSVD